MSSWAEFIERIDLSRMPCKVTLEYLPGAGDAIGLPRLEQERLHITLHVKDIFDGHASEVHHISFIPPGQRVPDALRADWIKRCVQRAFVHEVEECMWLDGEQLYFPHANEPSAVTDAA